MNSCCSWYVGRGHALGTGSVLLHYQLVVLVMGFYTTSVVHGGFVPEGVGSMPAVEVTAPTAPLLFSHSRQNSLTVLLWGMQMGTYKRYRRGTLVDSHPTL